MKVANQALKGNFSYTLLSLEYKSYYDLINGLKVL